MSHVDEGTIHAYLDGALAGEPQHAQLEAHLAACPECRVRLDTERAVRARAIQVLLTMAPDAVRIEPFEQIVAARRRRSTAADASATAAMHALPSEKEAETTGDAARRTGRRFFMPLTLAATVVLALTATWMATRMRMESASTQTSADEMGLGNARADSQAAAEATGVATVEGKMLEQTGQAESARRARAMEATPPPAAATDLSSQAMQKARTQESDDPRNVAQPDRAANVREEEQRNLLQQQLQPRIQQQIAGQTFRYAVIAPQALGGGLADSNEVKRIGEAAAAQWRSVTRDEATRILRRVPAGIDGLPVVSTEVGAVATDSVVRITLQLDSLNTVEILQWPVAQVALDEIVVTGRADRPRDAAASRAAADSMAVRQRAAGAAAPTPSRPNLEAAVLGRDQTAAINTVTVPMLGVKMVVLRGALSADSLRALAARIR